MLTMGTKKDMPPIANDGIFFKKEIITEFSTTWSMMYFILLDDTDRVYQWLWSCQIKSPQ